MKSFVLALVANAENIDINKSQNFYVADDEPVCDCVDDAFKFERIEDAQRESALINTTWYLAEDEKFVVVDI